MRIASEGKVKVSVPEGVFCNPEMELCRDISSLCVGAIGGKLSILDAMCASGIRGLRYKKENPNVKSLVLSDMSRKAVAAARKNAKANGVKCKVLNADAREILRKGRGKFDFVELDPFGSPVPFLYDAASSFEEKEGGFISATATDMAVLCGASHAACLKNYGAAPLNSECCHENAVRILAGKIVLTCAPFNLSAEPIYSISHRHYVKVIFRLESGADKAVAAVKRMGFVSYCPSCCFRIAGRLPLEKKCPECSHQLMHGGPLWLGRLWDATILEMMVALNAKRGYGTRNFRKNFSAVGNPMGFTTTKAGLVEKMLRTQLAESKVEAYGYYDLHVLARKLKGKIASMDRALETIRASGFAAERTHFCPTAIRTDAPHMEIARMVKGE